MESTFHKAFSTQKNKRESSLPTKIKIKTNKLPRDFFRQSAPEKKDHLGCKSRGSTCDDDSYIPSTPSFRGIARGSSSQL